MILVVITGALAVTLGALVGVGLVALCDRLTDRWRWRK